jgi:hypothetical protein
MLRFMNRRVAIALALLVLAGLPGVLTVSSGALMSQALAKGAEFAGPGPGVTGNDTGGIFPYTPNVEAVYQQIAEDWCARWQRFAKITSIHRVYGDYIGFVCYDRAGKIH